MSENRQGAPLPYRVICRLSAAVGPYDEAKETIENQIEQELGPNAWVATQEMLEMNW
jgi:hypothetical protein